MTSPGKGRLSPATTGWVLALMFFGLALFILVPWKRQPEPEPTPAPYVKPPNKLAAYGLSDNPDWSTLPTAFDFFAADAEWIDDKTKFAYWHPGVQRYEYYFEATRMNGSYRFREISEPKDESLVLDESEVASAEWPIRFYKREEDLTRVSIPVIRHTYPRTTTDAFSPEKPKRLKPVELPPPDLKLPPPDLAPKK